jgi:hypothetical protein
MKDDYSESVYGDQEDNECGDVNIFIILISVGQFMLLPKIMVCIVILPTY